MMDLIAYTDGSGTLGQRPSGAGVVLYEGDTIVCEASRHLGLGTNNHAELSAIRIALYMTSFDPFAGRDLLIRSDSEYAIWMSTGRRPLDPDRPNARLIHIIRRALVGRSVRFEHVPGHAGIPGNERADELAGLARLRPFGGPKPKKVRAPKPLLSKEMRFALDCVVSYGYPTGKPAIKTTCLDRGYIVWREDLSRYELTDAGSSARTDDQCPRADERA